MKVLMQPSRLAVILLLALLPLSVARQCCMPSLIEPPPSPHCSHSDRDDAPAACKAPNDAVFERAQAGPGLESHLRAEKSESAAMLASEVPLPQNGWLFQRESDSGPPAGLAFLRNAPLLI